MNREIGCQTFWKKMGCQTLWKNWGWSIDVYIASIDIYNIYGDFSGGWFEHL